MSLMRQTALTRYYSAKKQGSALKDKEAELFGNSVGVLRTPKTVTQASKSATSETSSLPYKRRRIDAAEKTPVTSKQGNSLPNRRPPTSVRKRLLLHEETEKGDTPSFAEETTTATLHTAVLEKTKKKHEASPLKQTSDAVEQKSAALVKKLADSGKLQELQARLKAIDEAKAALSNAQTVRKAQCTTAEDPSYVRFHHLTEPRAPSLTLPYGYNELAEIFRCCDTIVSMLFNRKEVCTFDKLRRSVEEMSKKSFSKTKLGQITAVYPDAYVLSQEKLLQRGVADNGYQLVVTPKLPPEGGKLLTAAHLLHRRKRFHSILLASVKEHHKKFLLSLTPPVNISSDILTRWHPKFPLDSVPAISPSALPESPLKRSFSSAQDVLDKVKGRLGERIEKALLGLSAGQQESVVTPPPAHNDEVANTCLKGISEDLLARIRARESFKLVKEMTLRPEDEKERAELAKLPEFIRITRAHFLAEQKAAVLKDDLVQKIRESFSSIQAVAEVESLITLASKVFPDWFKVLTIRRGTFVKIVRETDINGLIARITNKLKQ